MYQVAKHGENYDGRHDLPILFFTTSEAVAIPKAVTTNHKYNTQKQISSSTLQAGQLKN